MPTDESTFLKAVEQLEGWVDNLFLLVPLHQPNNTAERSTAVAGRPSFLRLLLLLNCQDVNLRALFGLSATGETLQNVVHERQRIAKLENLRRIEQLLNPPRLQDEL